jgi:hypothetical protein
VQLPATALSPASLLLLLQLLLPTCHATTTSCRLLLLLFCYSEFLPCTDYFTYHCPPACVIYMTVAFDSCCRTCCYLTCRSYCCCRCCCTAPLPLLLLHHCYAATTHCYAATTTAMLLLLHHSCALRHSPDGGSCAPTCGCEIDDHVI